MTGTTAVSNSSRDGLCDGRCYRRHNSGGDLGGDLLDGRGRFELQQELVDFYAFQFTDGDKIMARKIIELKAETGK